MIRLQDTRRRSNRIPKPFNWFMLFWWGIMGFCLLVFVGIIVFWFMMAGVAMDQAHVIQTEGAQAVLQKFYCGKNPECKLPF